MLSLTLFLSSIAALAVSYPAYDQQQQYGNGYYDQQYSMQSSYYPSSSQRRYQNGYQSYPGMQGSYQDYQGNQGGYLGRYQGGYQGYQGYQGDQGYQGYQGDQGYQRSQGSQMGYPSRYRGSDSSFYSPFMDLTNYYGSQGVPQYYGYPSSASYQMTPYYQNQNQYQYNMQEQQQQYNTPSQSSWSPMYYGNGNGYQQSQLSSQESSMRIRPFQSTWGQTQRTNNWGNPYQFTKVNAQVTDENVEGSGMDSSEQTSSPVSTDDSQMITSDD
ncbi:Protein CBG23308 [Caenorhabditis briggsae]|uniref:Protein CBG23308 n=2 Tax=Caenorhabditis briggsae TaxID=6238 RepID=A8Y483_CAEBR|nr:Protein CBG23308 [Caenorhabditis briggsae]UMM34823.1 hypothetical protein L5515_007722 [Caenorhabditis briggsae]CAP39703.1 Protein CBG23308 [Caenorhabditis briggsae]